MMCWRGRWPRWAGRPRCPGAGGSGLPAGGRGQAQRPAGLDEARVRQLLPVWLRAAFAEGVDLVPLLPVAQAGVGPSAAPADGETARCGTVNLSPGMDVFIRGGSKLGGNVGVLSRLLVAASCPAGGAHVRG